VEQEWWYADGNAKTGPLPLSDLLQRLGDDRINLDTLVWQPGWKEWIKLVDVEAIRTPVLEVIREQRRRIPPPLPTSNALPPTQSAFATASPATAVRPTEKLFYQVRPWTRFWARLFDIYVFSFIFGVVAVLLFPLRITDKGQELLLGMVALFTWAFVEPVFLASFGTTPGKWFMKIKLSVKDSSISYSRALSRSLKVWWRGMGIGFPLVALFTMAIGAGRLRKNGITSWDKEGGFVVTHERVGWLRSLGMALVMFAFLLLQAIGSKL
jgi:hypothetical protein